MLTSFSDFTDGGKSNHKWVFWTPLVALLKSFQKSLGLTLFHSICQTASDSFRKHIHTAVSAYHGFL